MSARDALIYALEELYSPARARVMVEAHGQEVLAALPPVVSVGAENFQHLLDRHAHELAEKIRANTPKVVDMPKTSDGLPGDLDLGFRNGMDYAADLIDSEVTE